jgi:hypothetical protein
VGPRWSFIREILTMFSRRAEDGSWSFSKGALAVRRDLPFIREILVVLCKGALAVGPCWSFIREIPMMLLCEGALAVGPCWSFIREILTMIRRRAEDGWWSLSKGGSGGEARLAFHP